MVEVFSAHDKCFQTIARLSLPTFAYILAYFQANSTCLLILLLTQQCREIPSRVKSTLIDVLPLVSEQCQGLLDGRVVHGGDHGRVFQLCRGVQPRLPRPQPSISALQRVRGLPRCIARQECVTLTPAPPPPSPRLFLSTRRNVTCIVLSLKNIELPPPATL